MNLPRVSFHALRHSHVSALIAAGLDVVTISRRIGHANPAVTLATYAHVFAEATKDASAALAIEAAMGATPWAPLGCQFALCAAAGSR